MAELVECIPNFSEGRNTGTIEQIEKAISSKSVKLLSVDPDKDYNRTVFTFAGEPEETVEAAFAAIRVASRLIDMAGHKGQHPRLGATDVCPFVPVSAEMNTCITCARYLGARVGRELGIPVYLYSNAAVNDARRDLALIRAGEYEGLADKIIKPEWKPDYGPAEFSARSGACIIGARHPQLAYNVNLNTGDIAVARTIAGLLRESGRIVAGKRIPGKLKKVRAIGVSLQKYGLVQVSMNLDDLSATSMLAAFQAVTHEAEELGYKVTGSEVCGMVSREALMEAGRYRAKEKGYASLSEPEIIELSIEYLGLNQLYAFQAQKRVLEYAMGVKRE